MYHPTEWQGQLDTIEAVSNRITADIKSSGTKEEQKTLQELLAQTSDPQQHTKIITEFVLDDLATIHFLKEEQKRLENLKFWDEVPELKQGSNKVWHFHPVAFIESLKTGIPLIWMKRVLEIHGSEHGERFRDRILETSEKLGIDPNNLLACMALETGRKFRADTKAPNSSATGLIQFMRSTAIDLGTTVEKLATMDEIEQMDYVDKYFIYISKIVGIPTKDWSLGDLYHAIFTPATIKLSPNDTVYSQGQAGYESNKGHDVNKDGIITKSEIEHNIHLFYKEGQKYIA